MRESDLVGILLRALEHSMPGGVGFKHNDPVTSGIPDVTWTWAKRTVWLEVKSPTAPDRPAQTLTMHRLARTGLAFWVRFHSHKDHWSVVVENQLETLVTSGPVSSATAAAYTVAGSLKEWLSKFYASSERPTHHP